MLKKLIIKIIRLYQVTPISTHSCCKYSPTCSQYMIDAINTYGCFRGILKGLYRILRCNPFSKGGYDPVIKDGDIVE